MLDNGTKHKIDSARNILVGKVPDPKSQVEQITIALIYKFMDDMDKQSEDWGGKATFFTGKYKKYSWSNIFDPRLGGFDLIGLYADALIQMNQNPNIPQLFRDIFKNAYLPYRDPETLKSFLKEINEFKYDHSERLGDAFEYLLSVLSSQGDAGQFRTPRHIIDFIVEIVAPKKNETVIDPACGTAGFLISSYKHILKANSKKNPGDKLTPDERKRLLNNFIGYDISPDMVRLSLVNMYLHGFADPNIIEYDTLTSEERWNDTYDVFLANPPFMSPKGGIRPHKRFSIKAKRSEVLFVDYIAEHLNPNGRAGVIVPEGIIFQAQNAYKNLRKMLVENYLYAVVSLPAGVFQPYSGVKTSILLMDKNLAKRSDSILFVKIENEGTDLGAKRNHIKGNELPTALFDLKAFFNNEQIQSEISIPVKKDKILAEKDYNLTMSRYVDSQVIDSFYKPIKLGEYITESKEKIKDQCIDVWSVSNKQGFINSKEYFDKDVPSKNLSNYKIIKLEYFAYNPSRINVGSLAYNFSKNVGCVSPMYVVFDVDNTKLDNNFLFRMLKSKQFIAYVQENARGGVRQQLKFSDLYSFKIPLPPLEIQKAIVSEIDTYQKIIDGARQVVDNYKPTIKINPDWISKLLGNLAENLDGKRIPITKSKRKSGEYPYYGASGIVDWVDDYIFDNDLLLISEDGANLLARTSPIAFSITGKCWVNNHAHVLKFDFKTTQLYVEIYLNSISLKHWITGSAQPKLSQANLNSIPIPFPKLSVQQDIVSEIQAEQELVNANKKLIEIYEQKIKGKISEVWGE